MISADDEVQTDYGWTDYSTANAIGIVRACFAAGRPEMIEQMLFDHVPASAVPQLLAARAAAMATTQAPPPRQQAATPARQRAVEPMDWQACEAATEARFAAYAAPRWTPVR